MQEGKGFDEEIKVFVVVVVNNCYLSQLKDQVLFPSVYCITFAFISYHHLVSHDIFSELSSLTVLRLYTNTDVWLANTLTEVIKFDAKPLQYTYEIGVMMKTDY